MFINPCFLPFPPLPISNITRLVLLISSDVSNLICETTFNDPIFRALSTPYLIAYYPLLHFPFLFLILLPLFLHFLLHPPFFTLLTQDGIEQWNK